MMVAVVCTMNIMMLSVAKYTGFFTGMSLEVKNMIHLAEFILTTPVLFFSGFVFYKGAYFGLKNRIVNMRFTCKFWCNNDLCLLFICFIWCKR